MQLKTLFREWIVGGLFYAFILVFVPALFIWATVIQLGEGGVLHGAHGAVIGRTRSTGSGRAAASSYRLQVRTDEGITEVSVTSGAYLECPDDARLDIDALALTFRCGGGLYAHPSLACPFVSMGITATWIWLMLAMLRERRARVTASTSRASVKVP